MRRWIGRTILGMLAASLIISLSLTGRTPESPATPPSWQRVQAVMEQSAAWRAARQRTAHPLYMQDGVDGLAQIVYVGEDCGDHICRYATLRVFADGRVERQTYDRCGEFCWIDDRIN